MTYFAWYVQQFNCQRKDLHMSYFWLGGAALVPPWWWKNNVDPLSFYHFTNQIQSLIYNQLLLHPQVVHVIGQLESSSSTYSCLWEGCKVFGKPSSSRGWVEKHVALHGGKFAFPCIVEGCRHRFSSQVSTKSLKGYWVVRSA